MGRAVMTPDQCIVLATLVPLAHELKFWELWAADHLCGRGCCCLHARTVRQQRCRSRPAAAQRLRGDGDGSFRQAVPAERVADASTRIPVPRQPALHRRRSGCL